MILEIYGSDGSKVRVRNVVCVGELRSHPGELYYQQRNKRNGMVWTDSDSEIQERLDWYRYKGIVEMQPAADVATVRHARWNRPYISGTKRQNPYCFCTWCGQPVKPKKVTSYCPNCGAKMDGDTP